MSVIWSGVTEEGAVVPVQVTAEGKVVAIGDGPQGDYLPTTGGNLTGDLTIDTDKITLNAADGSITAANIGFDNSIIGQFGDQTLSLKNTNNAPIDFFTNNTQRMRLTNVGNVLIGGTLPAAPNIELNADVGTGNFKSTITITDAGAFVSNRSTANNDEYLVGIAAGQRTAAIRSKGSIDLGPNIAGGDVRINLDGTDGSITAVGGACGFTSAGEIFFTSRNSRYKLVVQGELVVAEPYTRQMELKEKAEQLIADKRETKPSQGEVTPDNDNA